MYSKLWEWIWTMPVRFICLNQRILWFIQLNLSLENQYSYWHLSKNDIVYINIYVYASIIHLLILPSVAMRIWGFPGTRCQEEGIAIQRMNLHKNTCIYLSLMGHPYRHHLCPQQVWEGSKHFPLHLQKSGECNEAEYTTLFVHLLYLPSLLKSSLPQRSLLRQVLTMPANQHF